MVMLVTATENKAAAVKSLISKSKAAIKKQSMDKARDLLDTSLVILSEETLKGSTHIEGESIDRFKVKVWNLLETHHLL